MLKLDLHTDKSKFIFTLNGTEIRKAQEPRFQAASKTKQK
jgi:hypothetical protein